MNELISTLSLTDVLLSLILLMLVFENWLRLKNAALRFWHKIRKPEYKL